MTRLWLYSRISWYDARVQLGLALDKFIWFSAIVCAYVGLFPDNSKPSHANERGRGDDAKKIRTEWAKPTKERADNEEEALSFYFIILSLARFASFFRCFQNLIKLEPVRCVCGLLFLPVRWFWLLIGVQITFAEERRKYLRFFFRIYNVLKKDPPFRAYGLLFHRFVSISSAQFKLIMVVWSLYGLLVQSRHR